MFLGQGERCILQVDCAKFRSLGGSLLALCNLSYFGANIFVPSAVGYFGILVRYDFLRLIFSFWTANSVFSVKS
jgi:hypothetical protein